MDLFLLKKIIGFALMPLSIVCLLLILAIIIFKKKPSLSFKSIVLASLILIFGSSGWVSDRLMAPLESKYSSYENTGEKIDYIVVLGCGHINDDNYPATSQLKPCSLQRVVEAVRIYQLHPEAQIITSGAAFTNKLSNAETVKQAAISLGVPESKILTEHYPKDTEEEAQLIAPRVQGKRTILITNADHMIRSVNYFNQQGVEVIPSPVSPWVKAIDEEKHWAYYLPTSSDLNQTSTAWYETLGLIAQWFKNL